MPFFKSHPADAGPANVFTAYPEVYRAWSMMSEALMNGPSPLSAAERELYLEAGEWSGRAGGYAIQGLGARLVAGVDGDYLNVVGLPATLLLDTLATYAPNLLQSGR